jgi:CubicO group peptidase (beta-lactamase class C family)
MTTAHTVRRLSFVLLSTVVLLTAIVRGEEAQKSTAIADAIKAHIDKHEIAGAVTVVATRDKVLEIDTVGQADIANNIPMKPDSMFWIASMTKPITGTAIMMLVEEGKISIDDPVSKYIPELAHLKTSDGVERVVTLKHLLTHSSGMADVTSEQSKAAHTLADLVPYYTLQSLHFEPGSKWQYCQSGINTLGRIVEIASGQSYPEFLQKRLFDPLGLKNTTFYPTTEQQARLAKSYKLTDGKLDEAPIGFLQGRTPDSHDRVPAANGGLFSTGTDYARFLQMILNNGELDGHRYLKPESVKTMTTVQSGDLVTGFTPGNGWGLAWCVVREPQGVSAMLSPGSCGHGGAYGTQAWIDKEKGMVFVLMVQRANFPNSDDSEVRKDFQQAAVNTFKK